MNQFEIAANEVEKDIFDGTMVSENCIEWIKNSKQATVSFSQKGYINKIKRLKERFPELIEICHEDERTLVAHIPVSAIKINIVVPREMSEEQRQISRDRLKDYWQNRKSAEADELDEETE